MTLRRSFMKWGLGLAAGAATRSFAQAPAAKYAPMFPVEKDAQLRLLRWSSLNRGVQALPKPRYPLPQ